MKNLVEQYQVGDVIENHQPKHIAKKITEMLSDQEKMKQWNLNTKSAALDLNWEKETQFLQDFLKEIK
jgi:hypothetical protein